jgi:hypothetical protein
MRFKKETIEWKDDSTNLSRKEQVVVSRLGTGYTRATHRKNAITRAFCGVSLTTEQILWERTETTRDRERKREREREKEREEKLEPRKRNGQMAQKD